MLDKRLPKIYSHITSLKDVKDLILTISKQNDEKKIICPISMIEFSGLNSFYFFWNCGCVISKKAFDELQMKDKCVLCGKDFNKEKDLVNLNYTKEERAQIFNYLMLEKIKNKNKKNKNEKINKQKKEKDKERNEIKDSDDYNIEIKYREKNEKLLDLVDNENEDYKYSKDKEENFKEKSYAKYLVNNNDNNKHDLIKIKEYKDEEIFDFNNNNTDNKNLEIKMISKKRKRSVEINDF